MSEEIRKVEPVERETKASELSEQDLDTVAGGGVFVSESRSNTKSNLKTSGGTGNSTASGTSGKRLT